MQQDTKTAAEPLTPEMKSTLRNVIAIMLADGKIEDTEQKYLDDVCRRIGAGREDVEEILSNLSGSRYSVPDNPRERICQLLDMVYMMASDGCVDHREMEVCIQLAECMGFDAAVVKTIVKSVDKGTEREQIQEYLQQYMSIQ